MSRIELRWSHGTAAVETLSAMLVDVAFDLGDGLVARPFAQAPWSSADAPDGTPGHLRVLGADFLGLPFGSSGVPEAAPGQHLLWAPFAGAPANEPQHGPSADEEWTVVEASGDTTTLELEYPADSPVDRVTRTLRGVPGEPAIDVLHTVHARRAARVPLGLHPMFALPEAPGALQLEVDFDTALGHPFADPTALSLVPAGAETQDLAAWGIDRLPGTAPRNDGVLLTRVTSPVRLLDRESGTGAELDWDRALLPQAMLWISDRGIDGPPWDRRYRGLGVEPLAAAFDLPESVSTGANPLAARGIATAVQLDPAHPLRVRHGVRAFRLDPASSPDPAEVAA